MPPIERDVYTESAQGLENPAVVSWTTRTVPAELPAQVYAIMGANCYQRFVDFSKWPDGWDNGAGRAIAWATYANLLNFLSTARFRTGSPPSLFLTNEGHFEINGEARDGSDVTVTISPSGAHLFKGADDSEEDFPPEALEWLGRVVRDLAV
jgi:hypothetical protein